VKILDFLLTPTHPFFKAALRHQLENILAMFEHAWEYVPSFAE